MATTVDFIEFVCEQIRSGFAVRYKKMFGDYMVYVNDKPILLVCDNCVFVKKLPELESVLGDAETGLPYEGTKEHYILDIENAALVDAVIPLLERITPLPKKKR
ncbi:MAG: hypothetical protein K2M95_04580 [Clostridiales bacterium]|nr:hypothetical protein [Clostridiales bacterium]